ncbi:MAG: asparagine synthase-related protein [bacterium]
MKSDRASMLASLEVRVPYLNEAVLDRILPVPAKEKLCGGQPSTSSDADRSPPFAEGSVG